MTRARARKTARSAAVAKPAPQPLSRWALRANLAGAALVVILFAWHREPTVASQAVARFEDSDASFHARRVVRTIAARAWLPPVLDAFEDFPAGGRAVWPPLHDAALAVFARLGGSTAAEPAKGLLVAAAFPVVELVGVTLAAAALAYRFAGAGGAAAAGWLAAITPIVARRGAFGEIDHNVTEVLSALLLALLAASVDARLRHGRRAVLAAALFGAAVLLAMGFYTGIVLAAALVAGGFLARDTFEPEEDPGMSGALAGGFALAALVLPVFAGLRVRPEPADPWRLGPVYVLVLAAAAAVCGAVGLVSLARRSASEERPVRGALAAAGLGTSVVLFALAPAAARAGFARGLGFIGSTDRWLATITEFGPTRSWGDVAWFLPAVLVGLVATALTARDRTWRLLPLAVPFLAFFIVSLVQNRFQALAAAFGAAIAGAAWTPARKRLLLAGAVLGTLAAASRDLSFAAITLRGESIAEPSAGEDVAGMLRLLTPDPGDPPQWGVLAPWDYGHSILWLSGRAVAVDPFGVAHPGFARALSIFLETSPKKALDELHALKLRYVVAGYPPHFMPQLAYTLGLDAGRFFVDGFTIGRRGRYEPTPEGEKTLAVRLHLVDGVPLPGDSEADREAFAHFRKIGESPARAPAPRGASAAYFKIFEVLP
jgi:MFS family permease